MPLFRPKKLSARGVFAELLPHYFRHPRHAQQRLKEDPSTMQVPHDADEIFYRIFFRRKRFLAAVMAKLPIRVGQATKTKPTAWCVATGHFVPKSRLIATQIFPLALGSSIMRLVCGNPDGSVSLWATNNGLMLSKPVKQALEDWALIIVPHRCRYTEENLIMNYRFHLMDSNHPAMSQNLYEKATMYGLPNITTGQLDGRQVDFGNEHRPMEAILYHHACCGVWKRTYLEDPECDNEDDFAARFLTSMEKFWPTSYVKQSKITSVFLSHARHSHPDDVESQRGLRFADKWAQFLRARAEAVELADLAERRDKSSTGAVHVEEQIPKAGRKDSEYQDRGYTDLLGSRDQGEAPEQQAPMRRRRQPANEEPGQKTRTFAAKLKKAAKRRQPDLNESNQESRNFAAKLKKAAKRRQPDLNESNQESRNFAAKLRQAEEDLLRVSTHGSWH